MSDMPTGSVPPPPPAPGGDLVYPPNPPKDPVLICVLNLIAFCGVGYLLMGQKTKGIVAIIACLIIAVPTCGVGSLLLGVVTAIDGYLQSQQQKAGHPLGQWTFFNDHR